MGGMLIPLATGVLLRVNGAELGIFNLVEAVDSSFLERRGIRGTVFWETWMTSTDQRWYDKGIRVGTKGVGAGKILADFRIAAEECLRRGCDEAAARQIVKITRSRRHGLMHCSA